MNKKIARRVEEEAKYLIETQETLRNIASHFNVSKSTVHKDMQERLAKISPQMDQQVRKILNAHLMIRHIKGGEMTKQKYSKKQ